MQWGEFQLDTVSGGCFRTDGGALFGVVPKMLWSNVCLPDDDNTIAQNTNCLLIRTGTRHILVDTGYGPRLSERQLRIHKAESGNPLFASLDKLGVSPDQIDTVILTHLHFDHAGGSVCQDKEGQTVPAFPNARFIVQRGEWETAYAQLPEMRGAYPLDNLDPLDRSGRVQLAVGDEEVIPGVSLRVTPGHTEWHQSILVDDGTGRMAVYLGDLCPTHSHLKTLWCMGFDLNVLEVRRQKRALLTDAVDRNWLVLFDHDSQAAAAFVESNPRTEFSASRRFESLDDVE